MSRPTGSKNKKSENKLFVTPVESNIIPKSDKTYRLNQQFRQFQELEGKGFATLGEIWRIEWLGGNSPSYHIAFNLLNGNGGFGDVASIDKPYEIPAGLVAKLAQFDSVEEFEKIFKPID